MGQGFKIAMGTLDKGRLAVAAGCVGIVQGCLEASVDYAKTRNQFGKPIAAFQLVQDMIADISVDADAARLLVWRCADLIDRGEPYGTAASKAKLFASEAAVRAANLAIQVHGGAGYVDELPRREVSPRRARDDALRRHVADPEAADRAGRNGNQRVRLTVAGWLDETRSRAAGWRACSPAVLRRRRARPAPSHPFLRWTRSW